MEGGGEGGRERGRGGSNFVCKNTEEEEGEEDEEEEKEEEEGWEAQRGESLIGHV